MGESERSGAAGRLEKRFKQFRDASAMNGEEGEGMRRDTDQEEQHPGKVKKL